MIMGATSAAAAGGNRQEILTAAVFGGISASMAYGVKVLSQANQLGTLGKAFLHGVSQGFMNKVRGGSFRSGFWGGFVGSMAEGPLSSIEGGGAGKVFARTAIAATAGGISAELGGGKFANGALSAAFVHLFNGEAHAVRKKLTNPTGGGIRNDAKGDGRFGAPRGSRKHFGIDLEASSGQDVVSPIDGTAVNYTGATSGYPMVDIIPYDTSLGIDKIRLLYVDAPSGVSAWNSYSVSEGQSIGSAANLQSLGYSSGVTPHVHVQVMRGGKWVDPTSYFFKP